MHVSRLSTYPVKSLSATDHQTILARPRGLEGDRRWMIVDTDDRFLTRREVPGLALVACQWTSGRLQLRVRGITCEVSVPQNAPRRVTVWKSMVEAEDAGDAAAQFLTAALGRDVRLVYMLETAMRPVDADFAPGHHVSFADGFPALLTTSASLAALTDALEAPLDMARFRPNIEVEDAPEAWIEDTWRRIRVGAAEFAVVKPCERCVMTTQDPDTGETDGTNEPLRTLGRLHRSTKGKIIFGQNLVVVTAGQISVGDAVTVLETGPSNLG